MAEFDTSEFLSAVRQRGGLSESDGRFSDSALLAAATRELREGICPLLWDAGAEWNVYAYSVQVAAGTAVVRMPTRAAGGRLRKVTWLDASANEFPLVELGTEDARLLNNESGCPRWYFVRNFSLVLVPAPDAAGTLSMPYYARPNALVSTSVGTGGAIGVVASQPSATALALTDDAPSAMVAGVSVDVVRAGPGFETLAAGVVLSGTSTHAAAFVAALPDGISAGDYLCLAAQAPVPQLPVELHGLLEIRTARRALKDVAEWDAAKALEGDIGEFEEKGRHWLSPRVDGSPKQAGDAWGGLLFGIGGGGYDW